MNLPICETCPFTMPAGLEKDTDKPLIWCRGAPPSAVNVGTQTMSTHPLLYASAIGCAQHPKWPRPRWWLFGGIR